MHEFTESAKSIRVTVPVSVAGNLDKVKGVVEQALGRLGCPACCSGFDIWLNLERDFIFDSKRISQAPVAIARRSAGGSVSLALSSEAGSDIKSVFKGIDQLADRLGCRACCSGFDLHLRHSFDVVADKAGKLREFSTGQ